MQEANSTSKFINYIFSLISIVISLDVKTEGGFHSKRELQIIKKKLEELAEVSSIIRNDCENQRNFSFHELFTYKCIIHDRKNYPDE